MTWFRDRNQSAEDGRQERMSAYVDGELWAAEQRAFEAEMAQDAALAAEVARLQQLKADIGTLPRTRAPRNYTLDAAAYGRPATPWDVILRPLLQGTAALAALVFVFALVLTLLPNFSAGNDMAMEVSDAVIVEQAEPNNEIAAVPVEVTVEVEIEKEVEVIKEVEITVEVMKTELTEWADEAGDMASEMDAMEDMEEAAEAEIVMMDDAAEEESVAYENAAASGAAPAVTIVPDTPTPSPTDTPQSTATPAPAPTPPTPTPDPPSRLSAVLLVSALFLCFCLFMLWLLRRGSD